MCTCSKFQFEDRQESIYIFHSPYLNLIKLCPLLMIWMNLLRELMGQTLLRNKYNKWQLIFRKIWRPWGSIQNKIKLYFWIRFQSDFLSRQSERYETRWGHNKYKEFFLKVTIFKMNKNILIIRFPLCLSQSW